MQINSLGFDLQGHRGCRGLMPENTIPAMLKAIDLGATTLEMDVVITKDNQVVLSHEPWMNAEISTKPDGQTVTEDEAQSLNIYKMTYEEVKKYDVGRKLHPRFPQQQKMQVYKPLLQDVITNVEDYLSKTKTSQVYYNIETKCSREGDGLYHPTPQIFIDLLMRVLKKHNIENRAIIQSFDIRTLQYLHTIEPKIKTALLIDEASLIPFSEQLNRLGFIPSFYSPHYSLVTEGLITACRKKGMLVIPWTVNDPKKMKELKSMGVDGLISDYPNLFSQL